MGLCFCSTTLLNAVQWQCNTILNEQKPIQNNPSPSIEGLGPLLLPVMSSSDLCGTHNADMQQMSETALDRWGLREVTGSRVGRMGK